jgi:hypothetical protein
LPMMMNFHFLSMSFQRNKTMMKDFKHKCISSTEPGQVCYSPYQRTSYREKLKRKKLSS